jgi:hypothetical protein
VAGWLWPTSCSWPCAIEVEVVVGDPPPGPLLAAAKTLWCKLIRECSPGTCDLPEGTIGVTGPDGVSVTIQTLDQWLKNNMVGIALVDLITSGYPCGAPEPRMIDPRDWQTAAFT